MNFQPALAQLVMSGDKTVTRRVVSRNARSPWWIGGCSMVVGRSYAVCPGRGKHALAHVQVIGIRLEILANVGPSEARLEGFADLDEFRAAWVKINGSWEPTQKVWRIEFAPPGSATR